MRAVAVALVAVALIGCVHATSRSVRVQRQHALQAGTMDAVARAEAKLQGVIESDALWDVYGGGVKDQMHEAITSSALANLVAADRASAGYFVAANLEKGVRWNDMPTGNKNDYLAIALFLIDFKLPYGPLKNTIVHNTHYGCQQHNHAMAPVFSPRPGYTSTVHFSNRDVRSFIVAQAAHWWANAVAAGHSTAPDKYQTASHFLGHISHMLQDSYAPGHAVRGYLQRWGAEGDHPEPVPHHDGTTDDTIAPQCGHVIHFEGYGSQEGNDGHGDTDHDPTDVIKGRNRPDKAVRARLIECSRSATHALLNRFAMCMKSNDQCAFAHVETEVFDVHFVLSRPDELAGGTSNAYVGKAVAAALKANANNGPWQKVAVSYTDVIGAVHATDADAIVIPRPNAATDFIWTANTNPALPHGLRVLPAGVPLCTGFTARTGPLALTMLPFLDFPNVDNAGADHNVDLRAHRPPTPFQI